MTQVATRIHNARSEEMVPKGLVIAMFTLMLATMVLVGAARWTDAPPAGVVPPSPVVQTLDIALIGDRNGAYAAQATDGTVLAMSDRDKAGFIGVMGRVVERKRVTAGLPVADTITLQLHDNGTLSIVDPSTGMDIALIGYGDDNVAAFRRLLN